MHENLASLHPSDNDGLIEDRPGAFQRLRSGELHPSDNDGLIEGSQAESAKATMKSSSCIHQIMMDLLKLPTESSTRG